MGTCWDESTCAYAAKGGHLDVLKWAKSNGCKWDSRTCDYAKESGNDKLIQWLENNDCPCKKNQKNILIIK